MPRARPGGTAVPPGSPRTSAPQWLIIQGRRLGKLLVAAGPSARSALLPAVQQPQPAGCRRRSGACALRSLVANAARRPASIAPRAGIVSTARGDAVPQSGQGCGAAYSAIGRAASNGPQATHA